MVYLYQYNGKKIVFISDNEPVVSTVFICVVITILVILFLMISKCICTFFKFLIRPSPNHSNCWLPNFFISEFVVIIK